jgi:hypothetical protein
MLPDVGHCQLRESAAPFWLNRNLRDDACGAVGDPQGRHAHSHANPVSLDGVNIHVSHS